ncbi:glycosyltransferase family 4 protein [Actinomadura scrupuli]|uniref:glycosyltransferase family 4 protein n=1 Tax=Actinomadura scrupuli TaxID=559629 RepID=UPI003D96A0A6
MSTAKRSLQILRTGRQVSQPRKTILVLADEWFSRHGGISTFNRGLCSGLADAGATVFCVVPQVSPAEWEHAATEGVHLLPALPLVGGDARTALLQRPPLAAGVTPDLVIGHGRITGFAARFVAANHFPAAARLQFLHVAPDETEWWRPGRTEGAGARADERTSLELALGADAAWMAAVGPRLHQRLVRDLHAMDAPAVPLRFDPGFDLADVACHRPAPGGPVQVLVLGRMADYQNKGLDLAARFLGRAMELRGRDAPELELLVRGAPDDECAPLRDRIRAWAGRSDLLITVRPYSTDMGRLRVDLARAHLMVMPSRAEAFGMVGAEAIAAGVPALVSARSGLGMLLREVLPPSVAAEVVLPMTLEETVDTPRWAHRVVDVLRDPAASFTAAAHLRRLLVGRRTWASAAEALLDALRCSPTEDGAA